LVNDLTKRKKKTEINLPNKLVRTALYKNWFRKYDIAMKSVSLKGSWCSYISMSSKMLK